MIFLGKVRKKGGAAYVTRTRDPIITKNALDFCILDEFLSLAEPDSHRKLRDPISAQIRFAPVAGRSRVTTIQKAKL
jgi:hypothetical protein